MLEQFGSFVFETFGFQSPRIFIFCCMIFGGGIGLVVGGFTGWKINDDYQNSLGDIEGRVTLQDFTAPGDIKILVNKKNKYFKEIQTLDGKFNTSLKHGIYSLSISKPGFLTKTEMNVQSSSGLNVLPDLMLEVVPKTVSLSLQDKTKIPYKNVRLAISKDNIENIFLNFDNFGKVTTPVLNAGEYKLILADPLSVGNDFLWSLTPSGSVAKFILEGGKDVYNLTLPRVILKNIKTLSSSSGTSDFSNFNYIAQKITLNSSITVGGIALGTYLTPNSIPGNIQMRKDVNGSPDQEILLQSIKTYSSGAISSGFELAYGVLKNDGEKNKVNPGTYWIIIHYPQKHDNIHFYGTAKASGPGTYLASIDGINWKAIDVGMSELAFYLTE